MSESLIHQLDVFIGTHEQAKGASPNTIIVLAKTSLADKPDTAPTWNVHFIGTREDYVGTYWQALKRLVCESAMTHPIATNESDLRKILMISRKRHRALIAPELQERGITECLWSLEETQKASVTPPFPIKTNNKRKRLELQVQSDQDVQTLIDHTKNLKWSQGTTEPFFGTPWQVYGHTTRNQRRAG